MTVLAFERYPVDPAHVAAFEGVLGARLERMRSADGNLWADLSRAADDPPSFIVLSEWRTAGDADAWGAVRDTEAGELDVVLRGEPTTRTFTSEH